MIKRSNKSERPNNFTGIDKTHIKADFINGSIVNGFREPILYSFALDQLSGHKIFEEPRVKRFKKVNKSVPSHITFT